MGVMKKLLFFALLANASCVGAVEISDLRVVKVGAEESSDTKHCAGFSLNAKEVKEFFARAVPITPDEQHYGYMWSPCYVRGTGAISGASVTWEIRALGTAYIARPGSVEQLYGDPSQREQNE